MPANFAVLIADRRAWKLSECGLTAKRLCLQKTSVANGRSFMSVSVALHGGRGAAIVPPLN